MEPNWHRKSHFHCNTAIQERDTTKKKNTNTRYILEWFELRFRRGRALIRHAEDVVAALVARGGDGHVGLPGVPHQERVHTVLQTL